MRGGWPRWRVHDLSIGTYTEACSRSGRFELDHPFLGFHVTRYDGDIIRVVMQDTATFPECTHWPALGGCLLG